MNNKVLGLLLIVAGFVCVMDDVAAAEAENDDPLNCKARANEEYWPCPPHCLESCRDALPVNMLHKKCLSDRLNIRKKYEKCKPACRCIDGFWRYEGKCVSYAECNMDSDDEEQ